MGTDKDPRAHAIIGAAIEVHNELGSGFLEAAYQEALALELAARGVPFQREAELVIRYKGEPLRCTYRADFVRFDEIIVELKAVAALSGVEQSQVLHYLRASGLRLGLRLNVGSARLDVKRLRFDPDLCSSVSSVI